MRGEIQGDDECILATVADLTKTPLSRVRATALAFTGEKSWKDVINKSQGDIADLYWKTLFYLCDCFDTTKKLAHALVQASSIHKQLAVLCSANILPPDAEKLPEKGKGVIVLAHPLSRLGHIVPWEDGSVFDPNIGKGEPLTTMKGRYGRLGFAVLGISQFDGPVKRNIFKFLFNKFFGKGGKS